MTELVPDPVQALVGGSTVAAALLAAAAVWWAAPARPALPTELTGRTSGSDRVGIVLAPARTPVFRSLGLVLVAGVPGVVLADLAPRLLLLVLLAALVLGVAVALRRRGRRVQEAAAAGERVHEACRILAGELRAGSPPAHALELAAEASPELAGAVRAAGLGADVPSALRAGADRVPQLRWLAASWQVSQDTGAGLADALDRLAEQLERSRATRRVVASELASARATARLLVALPVVALVLASGTGAGPWTFLLDTGAGRLCLVLGVGLELAGLWWIESIAASVERQA